MKKKIILHSIGNEENINYYVFDKKQEVAQEISKIFYKIFNLSINLEEEYDEKKGEFVKRKRKISKYIDYHETLSRVGKNFRIDIFYGSKRMFVVINCSQQLRKEFNESLEEITFMIKPKLRKYIK